MWLFRLGTAVQGEGTASAKCPGQSICGIWEETIGGQCDKYDERVGKEIREAAVSKIL